MSPLFGKKCSNCEFENNGDARFCAKCGSPLAGAKGRKCGVCGTDNKLDAIYCKECGRLLSSNQDVEVKAQHWSRNEGDFAARLEVFDLPGIFSKKLEVEIGTQAMIISGATPQEILPPGLYTLDSVGKTIARWFNGVPKAATVLLVDASPVEMVIQIANRFTSDPLPISLAMRLVIEVDDASKFLINVLRGRERYSVDDMQKYIEPEIAAVVDDYLAQHTLEQLVKNNATRNELELAIEEALRKTFRQYGLKLISLRTAELDLEVYDKIKGIKGKNSLLLAEGEAELEADKLLSELRNKVDLQDLTKETSKVELEEKKANLYQRMRQTVANDKMNEVRSEVEFNKFLDDIDKQKLLSEKERQDLLRGWKEESEDHDRARAFMLAKADVEEKYQLQVAAIKASGETQIQEQETQLDLARRRADMTLQIEEQKWQAAIKQQQAVLEVSKLESEKRRLEFDQDMDEAEKGLKLLDIMKRQKAALEAEIADRDLDRRLKEARQLVEIEIVKEDAAHKREMERMDKLATLGTEALIAASPVEQGRILQDLKRLESFKDMSEDQILALAAEKNPELGKVFEEKFRAIAEGKASEREREMYEKLLGESKDYQKLLMETQKDAMDRLQQTSQHGMDTIKEISVAYAQKGSDPLIITGQGGNSISRPSDITMNQSQEETKTCPGCGRQVVVTSRFCQYCNNEFKDMK